MSFANKPYTSSALTASKQLPLSRAISSKARNDAQCGSINAPLNRSRAQGRPLPGQPLIISSSVPSRLTVNSTSASESKRTATDRPKAQLVSAHQTAVSALKVQKPRHSTAAPPQEAAVSKRNAVAEVRRSYRAPVSGTKQEPSGRVRVAPAVKTIIANQCVTPSTASNFSSAMPATVKTSRGPASGPARVPAVKQVTRTSKTDPETRAVSSRPTKGDASGKPISSIVSTATSTPLASVRPSAALPLELPSIQEIEVAAVIPDMADSEKETKAVALAVSMGLDDQKLSDVWWFARRFRKSYGERSHSEEDMLLKCMQLLDDPFSVVAASEGVFRPTGMRNPENACFLNAGVQAVMSSSFVVETLGSACMFSESPEDASFQRATLASIASVTSGANFSADVFLGRFFPIMKRGKHCCANEFLSNLLTSVAPAVAVVHTSPAERRGRAKLRDLYDSATVLGNVKHAGSLLVGVNPHYGDRFNWHCVDFERKFTPSEGDTFELKALVFWEPLSHHNGKVRVDEGHYWSVAKRGDSWFRFDDMTVTPVSGPEQFCTGNRCVLVSLLYDRVHVGHSGLLAGLQ